MQNARTVTCDSCGSERVMQLGLCKQAAEWQTAICQFARSHAPSCTFPSSHWLLAICSLRLPRSLKNISLRRFSIIKKTAVTGFLRHLHLPTCSGMVFFSYSFIIHESFTFFRNYGAYSGLHNHKTNLQCWRTKVSARSILYMYVSKHILPILQL